MKVIWVTLALLGNLGVLHAQNKFSANAELPGHIKSVSGKVVLVADFTHKDTEGKIPVYLINGSEKSIKLMAQDGDVYLKLETRDDGGKWRRAQPHAFSWCGNSYMNSPELTAGHFMKITGYQPAKGKPGKQRKIRYALYQRDLYLTTKPGMGVVLEKDIDLASRDAMAVDWGSFEFVSQVALGEIVLKNEMDHIKDLQASAIYKLGELSFDKAKSLEVLKKVREKFPKHREIVNQAIQSMQQRAKKELNIEK